MTPAARVATAILVLDQVLSGAAAEQSLTRWARASRYAGSGDRAAVRYHVYDALRCRRSFAALGGAGDAPTGRQLMIGAVRAAGIDAETVFTGAPHAPPPLTEAERTFRFDGAVPPDLPEWLLPRLRASLGEAAEAVLALQRSRAPVFLRVNMQRATRADAQTALAADGIACESSDLAETALRIVSGAPRLRAAAAYLDGRVELQDAASQAAVALLPLTPADRVLDFCAGGGGKTLGMAGRVAGLRLYAHDAAPDRMRDLPERAARAGIRVSQLATADLPRQAPFDLVLVDAPCSGSGTWRRTPDAKWRLTPDRLDDLHRLQARILRDAAEWVRPGGTLAYMTCSLLDSENGDQVAALASEGGWVRGATRRLLPTEGGDGFYVAILTRES